MDDDDFLAALRDQPDDNDLRLAYADWLEERGDPRSEYLRLSVRLVVRERVNRDASATRASLDELARTIDGEWLTAVGIRYDVVLEWVDDARRSAAVVTLAVLTGESVAEANERVGLAPVVVATLPREDAGRFARLMEAGRLTKRERPGGRHQARPGRPVCRVSVRLAATSHVPSPRPGPLLYHDR